MPELRWVISYETLKFNTPDGDLHKDQYAVFKGNHLVRWHPENNNQPVILESLDDPSIDIPSIIKDKELVEVIEGEHMYYDEFALPDGRLYRVPSDEKKYKDLAKPNALKKSKNVSKQNIDDIIKDDVLWENVR